MLRWILGGREAQGSVEKNPVLFIGEEQPKNWFTELQVLKGHFDIVRFLVQIDDFRKGELSDLVHLAPPFDKRLTVVCAYSCIFISYIKGFNVSLVLSQGISATVELPKNCIAAAMDKEIVIFRLTMSTGSQLSVAEVRRLSDHQDSIHALININDGLFASGSHVGELILWDAVDWTIMAYEHILWEESQTDTQAEIRLAAPKPSEMSIQQLTSDGELMVAAVGSGLYVYSVITKSVVAYRKTAHDSNVLHTMLLPDGGLMSCSEDGSVRIWEMQDLLLPAEPASAGFFGMWTFGRSNKQVGPPVKKVLELPSLRTLELTGDLIGHSGAVQMFVSFGEKGLVTCSTDHLLIAWKNRERESHLRSLALFRKLEENGGL
uniref:WD repeat domain 41 n=1 Tax=Salmo trutta TaxID=8032 RepID=A0A674B737_SALTR